MVGEASETGTLELLQKARGPKKSVQAAYDEIIKAGWCLVAVLSWLQRNNENVANSSQTEYVKPSHMRILKFSQHLASCSFYAEDGGLLMGYEID